jgi:hypothetical protein
MSMSMSMRDFLPGGVVFHGMMIVRFTRIYAQKVVTRARA